MAEKTISKSIQEKCRQISAEPVDLHVQHQSDVSWKDAVAVMVDGDRTLVGLITARQFSGFVKVCFGPDGPWLEFPPAVDKKPAKTPADTEIFEIRVFNETIELRWNGDAEEGNLTGTAVLISESALAAPKGWSKESESPRKVYKRDNQYLLWGEASEKPEIKDGFCRLFEHRLGDLWVPIDQAPTGKARLTLQSIEYFSLDNFGNLEPIAERLTKTGVYVPETSQQVL